MAYSSKRQRFLVNQGYSYKAITKLAGMDEVSVEVIHACFRVHRWSVFYRRTSFTRAKRSRVSCFSTCYKRMRRMRRKREVRVTKQRVEAKCNDVLETWAPCLARMMLCTWNSPPNQRIDVLFTLSLRNLSDDSKMCFFVNDSNTPAPFIY